MSNLRQQILDERPGDAEPPIVIVANKTDCDVTKRVILPETAESLVCMELFFYIADGYLPSFIYKHKHKKCNTLNINKYRKYSLFRNKIL